MGPINETGFQTGWNNKLRVRFKKPRDPDVDPLPYKTKSLVAMLRRRLTFQNSERGRMSYINSRGRVDRPLPTVRRKPRDIVRGSVGYGTTMADAGD